MHNSEKDLRFGVTTEVPPGEDAFFLECITVRTMRPGSARLGALATAEVPSGVFITMDESLLYFSDTRREGGERLTGIWACRG